MKITVTDKNGVVYQLVPKDRLALNVKHPDCHRAADAFWAYWNENGETHKRGYYESTWGAINCALRTVGVVEHDYMLAVAPEPELPEGLEPVALCRGFYGIEWEPNYSRRLEDGTILVLQSAALSALAKKDAEIAKHEEESGRVIAWQLKTIERQAELIEKFQEALLLYSNPNVAGQPEEAKGALAAIKEHFGDKE